MWKERVKLSEDLKDGPELKLRRAASYATGAEGLMDKERHPNNLSATDCRESQMPTTVNLSVSRSEDANCECKTEERHINYCLPTYMYVLGVYLRLGKGSASSAGRGASTLNKLSTLEAIYAKTVQQISCCNLLIIKLFKTLRASIDLYVSDIPLCAYPPTAGILEFSQVFDKTFPFL